MLQPKAVELLEWPLDGQPQFQEATAPTTGEIYLHQVVKLVSGVVTPLAGNEATGFFLAISDTTPTLPQTSTASVSIGEFVGGSRPTRLRVIPLQGRLAIMSVLGNITSAAIGQTRGLKQEGRYTVVDLANTTNAAVTILELVEGRFGAPWARVLVRFN